MSAKPRVLIIGPDGYTWHICQMLIAKGVMPNLKRLIDNGCHGNLESVIPFETSPAWSSFQTGCHPGKTGIFAFHSYIRNEHKIHLNSFADNKMPSVWELLSQAGKKVISINMPVSSPPPKVNGIMIPGLMCPGLSPDTVHPSEVYDKYIKPNKEYMIVNYDKCDDFTSITEQSIITEKARCRLALDLMKDHDWDVFSFQLQSTDQMQHIVWSAFDESAKGYSLENQNTVIEFYKACDDIIGELMEAVGDDVLKLVVSDHGFCKLEGVFCANVWLRDRGYLQVKPDREKTSWEKTKDKVPPLKFMARQYGEFRKMMRKAGSTPVFSFVDYDNMRRLIDLDHTTALCLGGMSGIVYLLGDLDQRKNLSEKITSELMDEFGPGSDEHVINKIHKGVELYGPDADIDLIPDLIIEYCDGYESRRSPKGRAYVDRDIPTGHQRGTHALNGILVAQGQGVNKQIKTHGKLVDIAPTVLAYLGVDVPKQMDGKVLQELFANPLNVNIVDGGGDSQLRVDYTDEEQARVEQQLSNLGYM